MSTATAEREAALARLRELAPVGTTVYTILRHVSPSGMSRAVDVLVIRDNRPRLLTRDIVASGLFRLNARHDALHVGGAGMDMGFHIVYTLSRTLHSDGYALRQEWL